MGKITITSILILMIGISMENCINNNVVEIEKFYSVNDEEYKIDNIKKTQLFYKKHLFGKKKLIKLIVYYNDKHIKTTKIFKSEGIYKQEKLISKIEFYTNNKTFDHTIMYFKKGEHPYKEEIFYQNEFVLKKGWKQAVIYYNDNTKIDKVIKINNNNKIPVEKVIYFYDSNILIKEELYLSNSDEEPNIRKCIKKIENGYVTEISYYNEDSKLIKRSILPKDELEYIGDKPYYIITDKNSLDI